jgi:pimeloyl-ACP methyl ester carboxylesterase
VISTILGILAAGVVTSPPAPSSRIVTEEFLVPATDPGIDLYVRNKRRADLGAHRPGRTILFVHGATYPAETSFDLPVDGQSWMDYVADRGYDVWLLDLRGYGKSTRPKEMDDSADAHEPLVRGDVAVGDIGAAVDFITARRKVPSLVLLAWSWGTTLTATYTSRNPGKVDRLVLYAPQWIRTTPSLTQPGTGPLAAYRIVTPEQARARWLTGVPDARKSSLIPAGWFEAWVAATFTSDPAGAKAQPPFLRAPNGVLKDGAEYWSLGQPYYDPEQIKVPVLLVVGEWDRDTPPYMAKALFPLLVNAPGKRFVELSEGTHTIILERNRMALFEAVQTFLDEGVRQE